MVASWHPGESWHRGRRRSGAEAAISPSGVRGPGRSTALTSPHSAHPTPPRPIHSSYPARPTHRPAPPRLPPLSPLSAGADASWVPSGPSSRSLAAPAGAAGGTGGKRRSPGTVSHRPAHAPQPRPRTPAGRGLCLDGWAPRTEESGGRAMGGGADTRRGHSRRPPRPSAPTPAAPGWGRRRETARGWAGCSARPGRPRGPGPPGGAPRTTAGTRRVRDAATRPCPPVPRRPAPRGLTPGSRGPLRGRKEQFHGLQLRVSSSWRHNEGLRLRPRLCPRRGQLGIPARNPLPVQDGRACCARSHRARRGPKGSDMHPCRARTTTRACPPGGALSEWQEGAV